MCATIGNYCFRFRQSVEDLQTGLYKILDRLKNHEDAWPFLDPVEEEYAPRYYSVIAKPMDLQRMEDKLDAKEYHTFSDFKTDFQLIVDNCRQYNGSENGNISSNLKKNLFSFKGKVFKIEKDKEVGIFLCWENRKSLELSVLVWKILKVNDNQIVV